MNRGESETKSAQHVPAKAGRSTRAGLPPAQRELVRSKKLSAREVAVLEALARGRRDKEIADELGVPVTTEHKIVRKLFAKFQCHSRIELGLLWRS